MKKITDPEILEQEYQRFIEPLKINPAKLESLEESKDPEKSSEKEQLIKLIRLGLLVINDENTAVFNIFDPVQYGEETINQLTFRADTPTVSDIEKFGVGKSAMEKTRRIFSFLVVGKYPSAFFSKMKSDDLNNFAQIAAFFLPQSD